MPQQAGEWASEFREGPIPSAAGWADEFNQASVHAWANEFTQVIG
jgi:hypothetical protein